MIAIILPAYNEVSSIPILIGRIREIARKRLTEGVKIIVIDDGSTDKTADYVSSIADNDITLLRHSENKGLGEALKTGLLHAIHMSPNADIIVTMDSDNTHAPGLLMRMVMAIDEGYDVVIASRYRPGARTIGLSRLRQFLSLGLSWLFRIIIPIQGVRDYSCGYRAYRAELLRKAFTKWGDQFINQSGFSCMVDILLKLHKLNAVMFEVPMVLHYDYKMGKSKMDIKKTIFETLAIAKHYLYERLQHGL